MAAESEQTTALLIGGETVAGAGKAIAVENPCTTTTPRSAATTPAA